jgi:hypothetical protein
VSPHELVWWATLVALAVVLALAAMQAARALREFKRVTARVEGYADLPVVKALERAERDGQRIVAALAQFDTLVARARLAIAVIGRGPIPPEIRRAVACVRAEIVAFRRFARR